MRKLAFLTLGLAALLTLCPTLQAQERNANPVGARFAKLRRGINLSHWFAQASEYSPEHLARHTTAEDMALIKRLGFDHVRFTLDPAPLFNENDPGKLNESYLRLVDGALDMILQQGLAVIVDPHPADEFKVRMNKDDKYLVAFARFWKSLAQHLAKRNPEMVFLETINEPMVEDGFRWHGIQAKLVAMIRAGAPNHTIIVSGFRWSGLPELLFMEPFADRNIIYNYHNYEPFAFTHQGATWAGDMVKPYRKVPYPSSPDAVKDLLGGIVDENARGALRHYGEEKWDINKVDAEIKRAADWAKQHGVYLTCNEFGVYRAYTEPEARAAWLKDMRVTLEKYGIGWTMWDYAGGFGVVTKQAGKAAPDPLVVQALGLNLDGK
jgi:endoglucanase